MPQKCWAQTLLRNVQIGIGGSMRYNYRDADIISSGYSQRFLQSGNSYSNTNSNNRNKVSDFNADFRMEWKPDSMTNIIFRPNVSYNKTDGATMKESGTFNDDPYNYIANPNDYLNFNDMDGSDPLRDIRVNATNEHGLSDTKSLSANATLQVNRKLNNKGRNITFRGRLVMAITTMINIPSRRLVIIKYIIIWEETLSIS